MYAERPARLYGPWRTVGMEETRLSSGRVVWLRAVGFRLKGESQYRVLRRTTVFEILRPEVYPPVFLPLVVPPLESSIHVSR